MTTNYKTCGQWAAHWEVPPELAADIIKSRLSDGSMALKRCEFQGCIWHEFRQITTTERAAKAVTVGALAGVAMFAVCCLIGKALT